MNPDLVEKLGNEKLKKKIEAQVLLDMKKRRRKHIESLTKWDAMTMEEQTSVLGEINDRLNEINITLPRIENIKANYAQINSLQQERNELKQALKRHQGRWAGNLGFEGESVRIGRWPDKQVCFREFKCCFRYDPDKSRWMCVPGIANPKGNSTTLNLADKMDLFGE